MYQEFQTSKNLERDGVWFEHPDINGDPDWKVLLGRASTSNPAYVREMEKQARKYRSRLSGGNISLAINQKIMIGTLVNALIHDFYTWDGEEWQRGVEAPPVDGKPSDKILPYTKENMRMTLENLPDMAELMNTWASGIGSYQAEQMEADEGN